MNVEFRHLEAVTPAALALFERAQGKGDTTGGVALADVLAGADLFEIYADGVLIGAYAIDQREAGSRRNVVCVAAAGHAPALDLSEVLDAALMAHAGPGGRCEWVTRRLGLVEKACARHGYRVAGLLLRKDVP